MFLNLSPAMAVAFMLASAVCLVLIVANWTEADGAAIQPKSADPADAASQSPVDSTAALRAIRHEADTQVIPGV